ncbi:uroporphyrinogen-III synthase [Microvirga puerhi]|uniref:Uroporphyrinogen-III synthase n=1 Tax=Microvirga puerhi TaxID=2876078 RepID=A0ABS7VJS1_9HYPH|nr:uroporphyrinogen-III synthase [Microvirga puerhi]MBZ6075734.1 uroporphyrinogen-III synthase [Microvirga puerhi]
MMRILLTRAEEDAARTAERLRADGHETVAAPLTRIVDTDDPQPAGAWDALIVTSAHAENALMSIAAKHCPVYAVGERTAQAVRQAGFQTVLPAEGDAVSLSRLICNRLEPGRLLLHVTGRHHKDEPALSLRASGFQIETWEAYEARAVESLPPSAIEALRSSQLDAALHYSRRHADLFLSLTKEAHLSSTLSALVHVCLSADVAAPFESLGLPVRVAERPDEDALLATLR